MQQFQTQDGHRPDLELTLQEINPYLGAIGTRILPANDIPTKAGTVYYQTLQADAAAQTGRTVTAAPTRVNITETSTTFSAAEIIKGYTIPRDSVKTQFRTIERADAKGAKAALRSVLRKHETDVAAAVLANSSATLDDIEASFITAAQNGLKAVRRYQGQKALVMSHTVFNRVMRLSEITGRFGLSSVSLAGVTAEDVIARKPEALRLLLGAVVGVDEVLVGDDDIWYDGSATYQDRAAIVALPDPADMSELDDAVFGKTYRYLPDGQTYPFRIESHYDPDTKLNVYDSLVWYQLKVLNAGALYILRGIDEANAVVTSTTES